MKMKTKHIIKFTLALLISLSATAQEKKWSLKESVDYALQNNITVRQSLLDQKLAEQDLISAKGNFLPTVNASASQNWNFGSFIDQNGSRISRDSRGNGFGVNAGVTLFNGFRNTNLQKQAELGIESSKIQLEVLKNNISLNVVNAYLNILFNREAVKQAEEQVAISQRSLDQVQELVDAGARARADLLVSKSQLASDNERLVNAVNSVDLSLLNLSQLLQLPANENFDIQDVNIDLTEAVLAYKNSNEILSYALENRPEIKGAQLNIDNAELNYEIARSAYYPTLSLGAGASTSYQHLQGQKDVLQIVTGFDATTGEPIVEFQKNGFVEQIENNLGYNVGFSLSIPIFNGFKTKASVKRAEISKERITLALEQEKQTLRANIEQAYADAKASLLQYESSKVSLESQELAFQNEQDKYDLGVSTSFQLEQVRNRLINAQSSFLNAKYNYVFKTKVLDFYLDKPITQ
ncbi:TolC family protein [Lacinutrix sp. 5H-3-7-4]|uniref:TolC family protein n=1 Tax=Lacinutrix sp. (strain 5H-3-7-4) TaxID=983544 RepID=UPI00020A373B|nr:TolC family protein [Lacinutrix sp. 5H-3-7-4]AEH01243.1 outer membrane efflux protein [Lacinutrix sp. 5H-3-7-4]